jgi:hypothetical protein
VHGTGLDLGHLFTLTPVLSPNSTNSLYLLGSRDLFALPIVIGAIQIHAIAAGGTLCIFAFVNLLPFLIPLASLILSRSILGIHT